MRLSVYTCIRDAIYWDLHAEAMLRHHLPLADEIIVNEGYSTDDTLAKVSNIDSKVTVFQSHWPEPSGLGWMLSFKDPARRACTGDWCLHLDCDEFIPEWEFDRLRARLETATEDLLPVKFVNFYGNYRVYHAKPEASHWPARKMIIHRNRPDLEFWGDGSNVRIKGQPFGWPEGEPEFSVHHFGSVRKASRLREKWRNQQGKVYGTSKFSIPSLLFSVRPHRWDDPEFMPYMKIYAEEPVKAVRDDPDEFVRDDFKLYELLKQRAGVPVESVS